MNRKRHILVHLPDARIIATLRSYRQCQALVSELAPVFPSGACPDALAPFADVRVRWQPGSPAETVAPQVGTWFDHDLEGGWRTGLPRVRPTLRVAGRYLSLSRFKEFRQIRRACKAECSTGERGPWG